MGAAVRRPGFPMFYQSTRGPPTTPQVRRYAQSVWAGRRSAGVRERRLWRPGATSEWVGCASARRLCLCIGVLAILDVFIDDFYTIFMQRWL